MQLPQQYDQTAQFAPATPAAAGQALDSYADVAHIEAAWEKATPIPLVDPDRYRLDCMGTVIEKSKYGQLGPGGWDIDHSKPKARGGTDHPNNLHALDSSTNRAEKRDQYPYHCDEHKTRGETLSEFRERRQYRPSNVDGRSSQTKSGELRQNSDGNRGWRYRSAGVRGGKVTSGHTRSGGSGGPANYKRSGASTVRQGRWLSQSWRKQ